MTALLFLLLFPIALEHFLQPCLKLMLCLDEDWQLHPKSKPELLVFAECLVSL